MADFAKISKDAVFSTIDKVAEMVEIAGNAEVANNAEIAETRGSTDIFEKADTTQSA